MTRISRNFLIIESSRKSVALIKPIEYLYFCCFLKATRPSKYYSLTSLPVNIDYRRRQITVSRLFIRIFKFQDRLSDPDSVDCLQHTEIDTNESIFWPILLANLVGRELSQEMFSGLGSFLSRNHSLVALH